MTVVIAHVTESDVRRSVTTAQTHLEKAASEIVWQIQNQAWQQLGYDSWDAMREGEYGGAAVIVPRADRPEIVARLRGEGLSQKQIGDTLGVSRQSVGRDLNAQMDIEDSPPTIVNARGQERPAAYAPREPNPEPAQAPPELTPSPAVTAYLADDQKAEDIAYVRAFLKAYTAAVKVPLWDAERLGQILDDDGFASLQRHSKSLAIWVERIATSRRGLRLIPGGTK